jgi:Tol biopolymer transport system component
VVGGLAWSPDGRWIAGTGGEPRSNGVLRIDVATGEVVQIVPGSGHLDADKQVSWSPDSSSIAFIGYRDVPDSEREFGTCYDNLACSVDVYVAKADGSNPVRVNGQQGHANMPRWSPDGAWLAFRNADFSRGNIAEGLSVVRPDGTGERTVTTEPVATYAWSPAGDRFLFVRSQALVPPELWEAALTGGARSLGVPIDNEWNLGGAGFSFDWSSRP